MTAPLESSRPRLALPASRRRVSPRTAVLALLGCLCALTGRPAVADGSSRLTERVEEIVVFKDGHALVIREGRATADASGRVHTARVPEAAVLGTVWATAEGHPVRSVRAEWHDGPQEGACPSLVELLRANSGRQVRLELEEGEAEGVLHGILGDAATDASESRARPPWETAPTRLPTGRELVALDPAGARERLVLRVADVKRVSGPALSTRCSLESPVWRSKRLTFDLGPESAGREVKVRLVYFTSGLRWIPSYRIDLKKRGLAEVSLQAEIVDDAEDLAGARVHLVVGVPNIRFQDAASPLTLERTLLRTVERTAPGLTAQLSNAVRAQAYASSPPAGDAPEAPPRDLLADADQDLFTYRVDDLHLARGGRATVPLWRRTVKVRDVYTLDLEAAQGAFVKGPFRLEQNRVWRQLELVNDGDAPWTTGAVLLMKDGLPLAQELLTYTPRGGRVLVPVTVAVNLRAHLHEEEDARLGRIRWNGTSYAKVRRHGRVTLESHLAGPVELLVRVATTGKVTEAEDGDVELQPGHGPNNRSRISWRVELGPGGRRRLTYVSLAYQD